MHRALNGESVTTHLLLNLKVLGMVTAEKNLLQ